MHTKNSNHKHKEAKYSLDEVSIHCGFRTNPSGPYPSERAGNQSFAPLPLMRYERNGECARIMLLINGTLSMNTLWSSPAGGAGAVCVHDAAFKGKNI
ncbi:hypothetical protein EVAR_5843_1 [Eumeta japonica]|uniref:Uncharacterized protein n=1 Tax=Eumeta variegata TaxID=151549 RepID=A0A4C1TF07_EUMVA|nr:hypothetical protein EVAR_5843_1 [Eumeta japonica]